MCPLNREVESGFEMSTKVGNSNCLGSPDVIMQQFNDDDNKLVKLWNYIKQATKNRWGWNRPQEEKRSEFNKFISRTR